MTILLAFFFLYLAAPTTLLASDKMCTYIGSLLPQRSSNHSTVLFKLFQTYDRFHSLLTSMCTFAYLPPKLKSFLNKNSFPLWWASFVICLGLLMWALFILFVISGISLPNSEQFQLLSDSHPAEYFEQYINPTFMHSIDPKAVATSTNPENLENSRKIVAYFVWGLKPVDSGNILDPNDQGSLVLDPLFSMSSPENQKWMENFCESVRTEEFYDEISNFVRGAHFDSCFVQTMKKWMGRDCTDVFVANVTYEPCCKVSNFPYDVNVFSQCVGLAARDVYRTPLLYFRPDIAGPKFKVENGDLAVFTIRVKTNITASLTYEKMAEAYESIQGFYDNLMNTEDQNVPNELKNGFFVSSDLDFYDLQRSLMRDTIFSVILSSGLCFLFLWIFSKSFLAATGAVVTVFAAGKISFILPKNSKISTSPN